MTTRAQCAECQSIREQLVAALPDVPQPLTDRWRRVMAGINENSDEWLDELLTKFPFHPEPLELSGKQHTVSPRLPYPELFVAVRRMLEHKTRTGHNVLMHD